MAPFMRGYYVETGREAEAHTRDEWIPESHTGQIEVAVRPKEFAYVGV